MRTFEIDELQQLRDLEFNTFGNYENLTSLYIDIYNNILFDSNSPQRKIWIDMT